MNEKECRVIAQKTRRNITYRIREGRSGGGQALWEASERIQPESSCVDSVLECLVTAAIQAGYTVYDEMGWKI